MAFAYSSGNTCLGEVIAYDPLNGNCRTIVGESLGYAYTQSGTHISALSHKNTEGGWLVASMMGYDQDGQDLLDQELLIAKVSATGSDVYRIAHHRSDEDQYDYWGEPHPVMSPSGTRVLFNSDWSGAEDGFAVDAYVVELPIYQAANENACTQLTLDVNNSPINSGISHAIVSVSSTGQINQGSSVSFKGGDCINLLPGFTVPNATTFVATIEACN